jgi:predicted ATPase/DNA-binding SARP family transcriptional activator
VTASELPAAALTIRLFGPFDACLNGRSLPALRFRKSQWLLALLVLRHGRAVEREWLSGLLWPETADRQALRNSLANLRQSLGPAANCLRSPTPHTLSLDLSDAAVDVVAFDAALSRGAGEERLGRAADRGSPRSGPWGRAPEASLQEAVALYRGPLLEGCTEDWAFQERQSREHAYLAARERLAALALERGAAGEAERHLRLATAADPLRQSTQRALMEVLAGGGDYAAALLCYRELRVRLHREMNAEPDAETQALFQQLRGEARRRSATRSRVTVHSKERDGGSETRPTERNAAVSSDLPAAPQPPGSIDRRRHNLPVQRAPLVGREKEVAQALQLLRRDDTGLLTLTGPGGSGKTRLSLQVAADMLADFEHGVFLVGLASIHEPGLVPAAIAQALGVQEAAGTPLVESLKLSLENKQLLLLLDNLEHLLAAAPVVPELLASCPRLKVLATSRAPLRLRGEKELPVPPLAVPPAGASGQWPVVREVEHSDSELTTSHQPLSTDLTRYAAVELFLQRARDVEPDFALTAENAATIVAICRRLEGLPLAIELAAVRLKVLPPQMLLARLERRLPLLTGGPRDAPARQQTLRDTIGWSYDLLAEGEKRLFRRLAVFVGGCTLEAAEAVSKPVDSGQWLVDRVGEAEGIHGTAVPLVGLPTNHQPLTTDLLDGIAALVSQSLLQQEEGPDGEPRFWMLETVREYAIELLIEMEDEAAIRDRQARFYLGVAELAEAGLQGHEQAAWLPRLDAEADNMRAALDWLAKGGQAEPALRLAAALGRYWHLRVRFLEGREWLAALLALPGAQTCTAARAAALHAAAVLAWRHGDGAAARAPLEESLSLWRELGNSRGVALCLVWLADILEDQETAFSLAEESLRLWRELGDQAGLAHALHVLGKTYQIRGQLEEARPLLEESLAIRRAVGDKVYIGQSLWQIGTLHRAQGDPGEAERCFEEALGIARGMGIPGGTLTLIYLGGLVLDRGDEVRARALLEECVALTRELGNPRTVARPVLFLAEVVQGQGDYPRAEALLQEALILLRKYGRFGHSAEMISQQIAMALSDLGYVAYHQGDPGRARGYFVESLGVLRELDAETDIAVCVAGLAGAAYLAGQPKQAVRLLGAAASRLESCDPRVYRNEKADYARIVAAARAASLAREFAAAWAEGRAMSLQDAVEHALEGSLS